MAVEVKIMGRPAASIDGHPVGIPAKGYVLIAILASARNFAAQVQEIRSVLWPLSTDRASGAALRQLAARIRRQARADLVPATGSTRSLNLAAVSLDAVRLRQSLRLLTRVGHIACGLAENAAILVDTYRGELLEGLEFEPGLEEEIAEWISIERAGYKAQFLGALRRILPAMHQRTPLADTIADVLLDEDRADETAWAYKLRNTLNKTSGEPEQVYASCIDAYRDQRGRFPPPQLEELRARLARSRRGDRPDAATGLTGSSQPRRKPERPLVTLTRALNGFGLDPLDTSLYEQVAFSLAKYRDYEIVERDSSNKLACGSATEAYALHVGPRTDTQLGFWLSLVNPQQRTAPSARLAGQMLWTGFVEKAGERMATVDRQLTMIAKSVVGEIERAERDKHGADGQATAYRLYLAGQVDVHSVDLASLRRARSRFRDALKLDEAYSPALSGISRTYLMEWLIRGDPDSNYLEEAWRLARLAVSVDREDGRNIHRLAHVELYRHRFDRSLELFDRALAANPTDLSIRADFADALGHAGQPLQALQELDEISAIDPIVPENHHWIRGSTEYTLERYDDAVESLLNLADPSSAARPMAAALAMSGQTEEAAKYVSVVRENYPSFRVADWMRMVPNKERADHERYTEGLVTAGL